MGHFDYSPPVEFLKQLGMLADVESFAKPMVDEALPIVESGLKKELAKHEQTGELIDSIKNSKAKKNKYGNYSAVVFPAGNSTHYMDENGVEKTRKTPVRNAEKLIYLEYGTSSEAAQPVLDHVMNDAEPQVLDKMQEVFNREALKK